jgi:DMSO/TMAO reductase YedYZ molybdopterin-dependent catalytic subunit
VLEAVGTAEWTGVPLADLLDQVGVLDDAVEIVFEGLDRGLEGCEDEHQYARSLTVDQTREDGLLLAYDLNGAPLPPQHGYPLRLVVPGWYGMTSVKWLRSITAVSEPFTGYQQAHAYRWRDHEDDPGTPVTRMAPRSLMAPPGIPVRLGADRLGCRLDRRRRDLAGRPAGSAGRALRVAAVDVRLDAAARGARRAVLPRGRRPGQQAARRASLERRRLRQQRGAARCRGRHRLISAVTVPWCTSFLPDRCS